MEELNSSELGTQSYWQEAYKREIANFDENGDPGDVWFGEDSAYRVISWIANSGIPKDTAIIDLGCGNGYTLQELAREGFDNLLGIDYCEEAITLAQKITAKHFPHIKYKIFDITQDSTSELGTKFGVIHDKGTYDAISLNPNNPTEQRKTYIKQVLDMMEEDGMFVITSCNWTQVELVSQFEGKLRLKCEIPTPQFKFGGKIGNMVSTVVFVK